MISTLANSRDVSPTTLDFACFAREPESSVVTRKEAVQLGHCVIRNSGPVAKMPGDTRLPFCCWSGLMLGWWRTVASELEARLASSQYNSTGAVLKFARLLHSAKAIT